MKFGGGVSWNQSQIKIFSAITYQGWRGKEKSSIRSKLRSNLHCRSLEKVSASREFLNLNNSRFFNILIAQMTDSFELERTKQHNAQTQKALAPHQHIEQSERKKKRVQVDLPVFNQKRSEICWVFVPKIFAFASVSENLTSYSSECRTVLSHNLSFFQDILIFDKNLKSLGESERNRKHSVKLWGCNSTGDDAWRPILTSRTSREKWSLQTISLSKYGYQIWNSGE